MQVTETFFSIQGEGRHAGLPTAFVRTTGCHLRCSWCDAAYAFTGGTARSIDDLLAWLREQPTKEVCFTGGEPLLQKDAWVFVEQALEAGYRVVVETSGNLPFGRANELRPDLRGRLCISMDIKCPSSGEHARNRLDFIDDLRPQDQLKFVVADRADFDFALQVLRENSTPCPAYLNPVGGTDPTAITKWLLAQKEPVGAHVGVQLHKLIWGDMPGH